MPIKTPPFKRLYENIHTSDNGCWEWKGQTASSGYGQIKAFSKMVSCHRLSYELYSGPIPEGLEVMHSCDNKICINPDHLSAGTHAQNMEDMNKRGRRVVGTTNPVRGADRKQSKQVLVLGKPYGSIKESEKALGLSHGTVAYWIKHKTEKAVVITLAEYTEMKNV